MKEINIGATIVSKRREKGITQDELAFSMGVSKASVSKWETGQSYPDISLLPHLAAYFNISIDQLMDYSPQMTREDIKNLYHRFAEDFTKRPFHEVLEECHQIIKKYYSCFPLLLQMAVLLLNHHALAEEKTAQDKIVEEIYKLCLRIKEESNDPFLSHQANSIQATCCLLQNNPAEVIDLLDNWEHTAKSTDDRTLSSAYLALGNLEKAKEILQSSAYHSLLSAILSCFTLLSLSNDDHKSHLIIDRISRLAEIFDLENLHVNTCMIFYLTAAQNCTARNKTEEALYFLEKYTDLGCSLKYPLTLHGDDFFDCLDQWFDSLDLGKGSPTDEATIRSNLLTGVTQNPAFATALSEEARYKAVVSRLEHNVRSKGAKK